MRHVHVSAVKRTGMTGEMSKLTNDVNHMLRK